MAISYSGTVLSAPVVVGTDLDNFPTHKSEFGKGGWHEVADTTERDAIPAERRTAGMAVYVTGENKFYTLNADLTTWKDSTDTYQAKLVSGTNIKTINNTSILGEGNIEIQGGGDATWGSITGTLSNQTDLNTALGTKLQASNLIQGSNITLTKSGNNVTIAATGEVSGTVNWGDVEGNINNQADLVPTIDNADMAYKAVKEMGAEEVDLMLPKVSEIVTVTGSLSSGTIVTRKHVAPYDLMLEKVIIPQANVAQLSEPITTTIYIVDFNYENSSYTVVKKSTVTISSTENMLDTPLYVKEGQGMCYSYGGAEKFSYASVPPSTDPSFAVLFWLNKNLPDSGTVASISNPTSGYKLNWRFGYKKLEVPNYAEQIENKVDKEDFEPIDDILSDPADDTLVNSNSGSYNNMVGPANLTWLCRDPVAEHTGYITSVSFNIVNNAYTTLPIASGQFSIASIKITPIDPEDTTLAGTWTCHDKKLDMTFPEITEYGWYTFELPEPLYIEAGDYIVIGGTASNKCVKPNYNSKTGGCALNRINIVFTDPEVYSGSFVGFNENYEYCGIKYNLAYKKYKDPFAGFDAVDQRFAVDEAKIDQLNEDLLFITDSEYVYDKIVTSAEPSACGPNNTFWIDLRDKAMHDGYITGIKLRKNTSEAPIVSAIATFSVTGSIADNTQRAEVTRIKQFTLPAGATEYTFLKSESLPITSGEHVAVCVPGQMYYGSGSGPTNNIVNGGSINSAVGDVLTGKYAGALQIPNLHTISIIDNTDQRFTKDEARITVLEEHSGGIISSTTYEDMAILYLTGSSLTEAANTTPYTSWPQRINDAVDINIINNGVSGSNLFGNLDRLAKHYDIRFSPGTNAPGGDWSMFSLTPSYIMVDDNANGSPTGEMGIEALRKIKSEIEAYGAKMLLGSEEAYDSNIHDYELTYSAFAKEAGIPYSKVCQLNQNCYPKRNSTVRPYPTDYSNHASYRAQCPYMAHKDLIENLPIKKNVKMFRPRLTYKDGNPTINDLVYDTVYDRLKYWVALCPGAGTSRIPGNLDNCDNAAYNVPNTSNTNPFGNATDNAYLRKGSFINFNTWALTEFILDKIHITKGTFEIKSSVEPTKVYVARLTDIGTIRGANTNTTYNAGEYIQYSSQNKFWKVLQTFTSGSSWSDPDPANAELIEFDNLTRTVFDEVPFTYEGGTVSATINDTEKDYQVYDKVRFVIYYEDGDFQLRQPKFYDYDGTLKYLPEDIKFEDRKFGTELLDAVNPSASWNYAGGAKAGTLPAPIANYTLYNDTYSHAELPNEGSAIGKTISLSGNTGYKRIAMRIVAQMWQKISTTRFVGTEYEDSPYITATKDDPLGLAAYVNSDYDYGVLMVTINNKISKRIQVYPGWTESYFEFDLWPSDTSIVINITKKSYVDDSYTNDDKPIFIHHISVQEIK